jgi:hypothetical protein
MTARSTVIREECDRGNAFWTIHATIWAKYSSDGDLDPRPGAMPAAFQSNQVYHFQASHIPGMGNEIYSNDVFLTNGMTDTL